MPGRPGSFCYDFVGFLAEPRLAKSRSEVLGKSKAGSNHVVCRGRPAQEAPLLISRLTFQSAPVARVTGLIRSESSRRPPSAEIAREIRQLSEKLPESAPAGIMAAAAAPAALLLSLVQGAGPGPGRQ